MFKRVIGVRLGAVPTEPPRDADLTSKAGGRFKGASELRQLLVKSTYDVFPSLSNRQRIILFLGTGLKNEQTLEMADSELTFDFLLCHGVKRDNIFVAQIDARDLRRMGAQSAADLRKLGIDALDLVSSADFTQSAIEAFGVEDVVAAFLATAMDAVSLAGSEASGMLLLSNTRLLRCCEGCPVEAAAVMSELGPGACDGTPCNVVVKTGIRAEALAHAGVSLQDLLLGTSPSSQEIIALGYKSI